MSNPSVSTAIPLTMKAGTAHSVKVLHIPSLDGLRAFSVMLVFLAHAGLDAYVPGGLGVTIFFFLSGYLITTLMRSEFDRTGQVHLAHFWLRRIFRILPPFYIVLVGAFCLTWWLNPSVTLRAAPIAAQALHVTNYWIINEGDTGMPMGTGVYWSLAVEEHFYLLFPWLYLGMRKACLTPRAQALTLWGICAAILIWRVVLVLLLHVPVTNRTYMATDTRVDSILFGCALAVWQNPVLDPPVFSDKWLKRAFLPGALIALAGCLAVRGDAFRETVRYSIQGLALAFVFVAAIQLKDWPPFRLLNLRPIAFLGVLSYSLYLVHLVIIGSLQLLLPNGGYFARGSLALIVSIGVSLVIYSLIERPFARLRKRLTN